MRVLLVTPPLTQLNTPYPATPYLTGFLSSRGVEVHQFDASLELALRVFSARGLARVGQELRSRKTRIEPPVAKFFLKHQDRYLATIDPAIQFLQGKDPTLAHRIVSREFLPEGPRFTQLQDLEWAFGQLSTQDLAKFLASTYLDDLADLIRLSIDPHFGFSKYGDRLAASVPVFDPLLETLTNASPPLTDQILDELSDELISEQKPDLVALTAPFPGNVYGALRMAQRIRLRSPKTRIALGGGYANTELRELKDPRVFDYVDFITLDDGERPLLCLLEHLDGSRAQADLKRTFVRQSGQVRFCNGDRGHDIPLKDVGTPTYKGLKLDRYLSIFEMLNPMHRLWSDGRWNKLTLAHGCYWKKCNFCDTSLDYIGRYEPAAGRLIVDRIEALIQETGETGFHFVDEAAPPAVLKAMAERLIERGVEISWWGNIRFEKTFTPELANLLARSGCIAVSGGLEVASDRLLKLMNKGVTVEQVARVTHALTEAGILVHAYLMYGFPTQTEQETIDALERVRQLFEAGCLTSAFWHRFSVTAHSPIGKDPEAFGITLDPEPVVQFARNDLGFQDPTGCDHERLGEGLRRALYNYMHGAGLDRDVRTWFDAPVPKARVAKSLVKQALSQKSQVS